MNIKFDKVYCVSYCRFIERQQKIQKVMDYLGIDFEFIYGADYNNLEILKHKDFNFINYEIIKEKNFRNFTHVIGVSYDHYTAVIHAYESGANSVLIMEDDATFINDKDYILESFNNYPEYADIIKFGCVWTRNIREKFPEINLNIKGQYIHEYRKYSLFAGGCQLYGLCNRDVMKRYIDLQQNKFSPCDYIYHNISNKIYALVTPLAIDHDTGYLVEEDKNKYTLLEHI